MDKLLLVNVSTRGGRLGFPIAQWALERAKAHGKFDAELVDLREVNLPMFDEPHHPRLRKYEHAHTKAWSARIEAADAFVFVTPEYNHTAPPSFVNAVDYLFHEWAYKAAAFVSYGAAAGGARAVQVERLQLDSVKCVPMVESVLLSFGFKEIENGKFKATEQAEKAATAMFDELLKWTPALKTLRTGIHLNQR